jgi:hypothetical protein
MPEKEDTARPAGKPSLRHANAAKEPGASPRSARERREAREAAALRDNLRRRKAAQKKEEN